MIVTWSDFFTPYTEETVKANATTSSGVYLLWVQLEIEKWICFYVGQALNIYDRFLDHLSNEEENECIKEQVSKYVCGFEYTVISKQADRDGIEKYLYDHYNKFECNKVDPGGKPIPVNLP